MRVTSSKSSRRTVLTASAVATLVAGLGVTVVPLASATSHATDKAAAQTSAKSPSTPDKGYYDARTGATPAAETVLQARSAAAASRPATQHLRASLGQMAVVDMDGLTGTPRELAKLDGYLTKPSHSSPAAVAMGYVRKHLTTLGLSRSDLKTFRLTRHWTDLAGVTHLGWTQWAGGLSVFGNGLQANVTKNGRLLSLSGSPVHGLVVPSLRTTKVSSRSDAIAAARADVGEPTAAGPQDSAEQVLFVTPQGVRIGWQAVTMSATRPMLTVVDASSGAVLYRSDLGQDETSPVHIPVTDKAHSTGSTGIAYPYFPGHKPNGGKAVGLNFTKKGWLSGHAKILSGNNSHTYSDVNDDNKPNKSEEVHAKSPHKWNYRLQPFHLTKHGFGKFCDNPWPCTWDPYKANSWRVNRAQDATQVFSFVNNWHDHLMKAPIGFTEAAGNFQKVNKSGKGAGHDAVQTQTDDGANTGTGSFAGMPDGAHIDNANMATPPDGKAPRMQMYLQHAPYTSYPGGDPWSPTNVGDEADTVYHEYTHGLSGRLVSDADGRSTLGTVQAGAMGEAWSDWYAMDYLVSHNLQADHKGVDIVMFQYDGDGVFLDRTEPMDCAVGSSSPKCTGGDTGHTGGYTYADYGQVVGYPEVHSDGEIWAQTLWDLRDRFGSKVAESLVTRAMSLSPANPSFIDERNAILLADLATSGGAHQTAIWKVFANRGMGYFAGALSGNDSSPGASFETPPAQGDLGSISGTVTDSATADPIDGAQVTVAFAGSPFVKNPTVTTASDGTYQIGPIPQGTYPKVTITAPGYDAQTFSINVNSSSVNKDAALDRDWAAKSGGATIDSFTGPTFAYGCGPTWAINQNPSTGWGSLSNLKNGVPGPKTPKYIVVKLPAAVDLDHITLNPAAICGDGQSASMGSYTIETSPDGTTYSAPIASGTFVAADMGSTANVPVSGVGTTNVRYLKIWNNAPLVAVDTATYGTGCQSSPNAYSGCYYLDLGEASAYGTPSP